MRIMTMRLLIALIPITCPLLLLFLLLPTTTEAVWRSRSKEEENDSSWQSCEIFFAPSLLEKGGWGVFAARDFEEDEIVEISPRYVALQPKEAVIKNTVLNDYHHGHLRLQDDGTTFENLACVTFGKSMMYNHAVEPNLRGVSYGREHTPTEPHIGLANGFVARRKIAAGEELFTSYGDDDGGQQWFTERKLQQSRAATQRKNVTAYKQEKELYCSKIHAGFGKPAWETRVLASYIYEKKLEYKLNTDRLSPQDHPVAVVNQDVSIGTILETAPALVLHKDRVTGTLLAPMSFFWNDLNGAQKLAMVELRDQEDILVQQQDHSTRWVREDAFDKFTNVVIFPGTGNIALVQRAIGETSNCKLDILSSGSMQSHVSHGGTDGSAGILLQLVATKDLKTGDALILDVPSNNVTPTEYQLLVEELSRSGHLVPEWLETYKHLDSEGEL